MVQRARPVGDFLGSLTSRPSRQLDSSERGRFDEEKALAPVGESIEYRIYARWQQRQCLKSD